MTTYYSLLIVFAPQVRSAGIFMTMLLRFVVKNWHLGHFTTKNMITNLKLYKSHVTFMTRRFAPCRMSKSWRNAPPHVARYNHGVALRAMSHVADERWRFAPCRMSHEKSYTSEGGYFLPCNQQQKQNI